MYLCQLCGNIARYPRLRSHIFKLPFGYSFTADYITPLVCTTCRVGRQAEASRIQDRRRKFWKRAIALYLGETYPSMSPRMLKLLALRNLLVLRARRWWIRRHA